jgi:tellurite methyltransferase
MDGGCDYAYAASGCVWGTKPGSLLEEFAESVTVAGWQVLDAGCGEGRNAGFLAKLGASVRAIDMSRLALDHAAQIWNDSGRVSWELADIRNVALPDAKYDLVVADGLLHWLADSREVELVTRRLQAATAPGGLNLVSAFNDRRQELDMHSAPPRCILAHGQYVGLYQGWSVRVCRDKTSISSHPGVEGAHAHSVTKIIAQSPEH